MKYYTGTKRKRKTRKSPDNTQTNTDESLQTSTEVEKTNPRKRGRPRKSSNLESEQEVHVKRSKLDSKKELKSTQSDKISKRSKDGSESESEEEAEETIPRSHNIRKARSKSKEHAKSTPIDNSMLHQSKAKTSNEKKSKKSSITDEDDDPKTTKKRSKQKPQKSATESLPSEETAELSTKENKKKQNRYSNSAVSVTQSRKSKRSNRKDVENSPSAELSDSAFKPDKLPEKSKASLRSKGNHFNEKRNPANRHSNASKSKKGSNFSAESTFFETVEHLTLSKASGCIDNTSSIGSKSSHTNKNSRPSTKDAYLAEEISDAASDSDIDESHTTSKSNSSQVEQNESSNRASITSIKTPNSSLSAGLISDSTHEATDGVNRPPTKSTTSKRRRDEVVLVSDGDSNEWQSDREFLQQQVNILMTPFEVTDCPELTSVGKGRKRKKNEDHLPQHVIAKSLKKWNYKVEDELLKTLNRQGQRRILQQLEEIRLHTQKLAESNMATSENDDPFDIDSLKKMIQDAKEELKSAQVLKEKAINLERLLEAIDSETLVELIKHTSKLLQKVQEKIKTQRMTNVPTIVKVPRGPMSHQEVVNKLFPQ